MRFQLDISDSAERRLKRLSQEYQRRISDRIDRLLDDPRGPGTKQLQGRPIQFSVRVGRYRIVYEIDENNLTVCVFEIDLRDRVYRRIR